MNRIFKTTGLILVLAVLGIPFNLFAAFNYRPEYAQISSLAYAKTLGITSFILPDSTSGIMQNPANIYTEQSMVMGSYGYSEFKSQNLDIAYIKSQDSKLGNFSWGIEYLFNIIPNGITVNNNYYHGKVNADIGFEQVLATGIAYNVSNMGVIGFNLKLPINKYQKKYTNGGALIGASYIFNFLGFSLTAGVANLGTMYVNGKTKVVYPDLQVGIGYDFKSSNNESVFALGFTIENNLGELINNSLVLGLGGKVRLFSTGLTNNRPLIEDHVLENQDFRSRNIQRSKPLEANIYLDIGFQFVSHSSNFSVGVTSQVDDLLFNIGVIFPNSVTQRFGIYASCGSIF